MKCPYATNQQTIIQTRIEYDENGEQKICTEVQNSKTDESQILTKGQTITQTVYEPMVCQKDECGAYYGGRCHYKD